MSDLDFGTRSGCSSDDVELGSDREEVKSEGSPCADDGGESSYTVSGTQVVDSP